MSETIYKCNSCNKVYRLSEEYIPNELYKCIECKEPMCFDCCDVRCYRCGVEDYCRKCVSDDCECID